MPLRKLLIANRGEIAVRIARAAADLGIATVAVSSEDERDALHVRLAGEHAPLRGIGAAPFLDREQLLAAAARHGCDAIHPGYGFLSESGAFARSCATKGFVFVGPSPQTLELFGDKTQARILARDNGVPVAAGTYGVTELAEAHAFLASLGKGAAVMVKALAGGGGRGIRLARDRAELDESYARCRSESIAAFGEGTLYVEQSIEAARHIEVQVAGEPDAAPAASGERLDHDRRAFPERGQKGVGFGKFRHAVGSGCYGNAEIAS